MSILEVRRNRRNEMSFWLHDLPSTKAKKKRRLEKQLARIEGSSSSNTIQTSRQRRQMRIKSLSQNLSKIKQPKEENLNRLQKLAVQKMTPLNRKQIEKILYEQQRHKQLYQVQYQEQRAKLMQEQMKEDVLSFVSKKQAPEWNRRTSSFKRATTGILGALGIMPQSSSQGQDTYSQRPVGRPRGSVSGKYQINGQLVDVMTYRRYIAQRKREEAIRRSQMEAYQRARYQQQEAQIMQQRPANQPIQQDTNILEDTERQMAIDNSQGGDFVGSDRLLQEANSPVQQEQPYHQSTMEQSYNQYKQQAQQQSLPSSDIRQYPQVSRINHEQRPNGFHLISGKRPNMAYTPFLKESPFKRATNSLLNSVNNLMKKPTPPSNPNVVNTYNSSFIDSRKASPNPFGGEEQ